MALNNSGPEGMAGPWRVSWRARISRWMSANRHPLLIIVLPTLLVGLYLATFAADQYQTEARFVVRSGDSHASSSVAMLQQMLPSSTGTALAEQNSIGDYLQSNDAVSALLQKMDLVKMYRRPKWDFLTRLFYSEPTNVKLLRYYRSMVSVYLDTSTGVTTLKVRGFDANDTYAIASTLLALGEQRVNEFSKRAEEDTVKTAGEDVERSARRVQDAQKALTAFRIQAKDIDPQKSVASSLGVVNQLDHELARTRAQLSSIAAIASKDSPQFLALQRQADAIEEQIRAQNGRLIGSDATAAPTLSQYEQLLLASSIAEREYAASLDSLKSARVEAIRQHLFVSRVVEPNLPDEAEYPRRWLILFSTFALLCLGYAIGWLILAGTREHAA